MIFRKIHELYGLKSLEVLESDQLLQFLEWIFCKTDILDVSVKFLNFFCHAKHVQIFAWLPNFNQNKNWYVL